MWKVGFAGAGEMLATTNLTSTYQARTVCKQNERDTVVPWLTLFHISWV